MRQRQQAPYRSQHEKEQVRVVWPGTRTVGAALHLLLGPPAPSCRHWGAQEEGEGSWVQGKVEDRGRDHGSWHRPKASPGRGGRGGRQHRVAHGSGGLWLWGSGEVLWAPLRPVGDSSPLPPVAQGMVPVLRLLLNDLVDKDVEHYEDVSDPGGHGGQDRELWRGQSPREPGALSIPPSSDSPLHPRNWAPWRGLPEGPTYPRS